MEHHGNNLQKNVIAIIPARYESTRLPGKLLLPLAGRPMILHTLEQAASARNISRAIVATDDKRIFDAVSHEGFEAVMTSPEHLSGSDRVAEVAQTLPAGTLVVNVQGDEPVISPKTIEMAVDAYFKGNFDIVTTSERIDRAEDVLDPNVVKVVSDNSGRALYFSRSPIPFPREAVIRYGSLGSALENEPALISHFRKHTGLYVYSREFLLEFTQRPRGDLEDCEKLEQLRAFHDGIGTIGVVEVEEGSIGVDTSEDFERVSEIFKQRDLAAFGISK